MKKLHAVTMFVFDCITFVTAGFVSESFQDAPWLDHLEHGALEASDLNGSEFYLEFNNELYRVHVSKVTKL